MKRRANPVRWLLDPGASRYVQRSGQLQYWAIIRVALLIGVLGVSYCALHVARDLGRVDALTELRGDRGFSNVPTGGVVVAEDSSCDSGDFSASRVLRARSAPEAVLASYEDGLKKVGWTEIGADHHTYARFLGDHWSYSLEVGGPNEHGDLHITVSARVTDC